MLSVKSTCALAGTLALLVLCLSGCGDDEADWECFGDGNVVCDGPSRLCQRIGRECLAKVKKLGEPTFDQDKFQRLSAKERARRSKIVMAKGEDMGWVADAELKGTWFWLPVLVGTLLTTVLAILGYSHLNMQPQQEAKLPNHLLDALNTATWVGVAIWLLGFLDAQPMPFFEQYGLKDIRFYCPPHAAIAVGMMNAPNAPKLYDITAGVLVAVVVAVACVEFGEPVLKSNAALLRAAVVGCATLGMKAGYVVFPPAAALAALYHDNAALKALGVHYVLTPGLTGALVLLALARAKIFVTRKMTALWKDKFA